MSLLAQIGGPTALFVLALALAIGVLMMRWHRYYARQDRSPIVRTERAQPPAHGPHAAPRDAVPEDLAKWEVQMYERARELSGQLDSKMRVLEHLTREADRAAARLEKALAAAGPESDAAPEAQTPGACAAPDGVEPLPPERREEICTLADYGFEPAEIARRLGASIGQVESVLGERAKR